MWAMTDCVWMIFFLHSGELECHVSYRMEKLGDQFNHIESDRYVSTVVITLVVHQLASREALANAVDEWQDML